MKRPRKDFNDHHPTPIATTVRLLRREIRRATSPEEVSSVVDRAIASGKEVCNKLFSTLNDSANKKSLSIIYAAHVARESNIKGADGANAYERIAAFMLETAMQKEFRPKPSYKTTDPHEEFTFPGSH